MKKGDLTTKAIGLAIAGVLAGSGLAMAAPKLQSNSAKPSDQKASDKAAASDKHVCAGKNSCKGKGGCKSGDAGCAGKNSCKGKGGCASADMKHSCKGMNSCKGQGGCKTGSARNRKIGCPPWAAIRPPSWPRTRAVNDDPVDTAGVR